MRKNNSFLMIVTNYEYLWVNPKRECTPRFSELLNALLWPVKSSPSPASTHHQHRPVILPNAESQFYKKKQKKTSNSAFYQNMGWTDSIFIFIPISL